MKEFEMKFSLRWIFNKNFKEIGLFSCNSIDEIMLNVGDEIIFDGRYINF